MFWKISAAHLRILWRHLSTSHESFVALQSMSIPLTDVQNCI